MYIFRDRDLHNDLYRFSIGLDCLIRLSIGLGLDWIGLATLGITHQSFKVSYQIFSLFNQRGIHDLNLGLPDVQV